MGMHAQNNKARFLELYDQFADAIFRHAFFRLSDRDKAKDIVQDTFIRIWNYIAQGQKIENPRALLYRIANNLIIDQYRRAKTYSLDELYDERGFDVGHDTRGLHETHSDYERLLAHLSSLPDSYREVLTMRHIDDLSVKEIAAILGVTENAVSVRIHRALEKLQATYPKDYV